MHFEAKPTTMTKGEARADLQADGNWVGVTWAFCPFGAPPVAGRMEGIGFMREAPRPPCAARQFSS